MATIKLKTIIIKHICGHKEKWPAWSNEVTEIKEEYEKEVCSKCLEKSLEQKHKEKEEANAKKMDKNNNKSLE